MKNLIYDKKKHLTVAESAEELTGGQLIMLAKLLHSNMNMLQASLAALKILSNKSWFAFKRLPADVRLNCIEHVQWVFEEWNLHHQLIPRYKKYYGPKEQLFNLTLSEFYFTERFYAEFIENKAGEALDSLISVLYRPGKRKYDKHKDFEGDIRELFTSNATPYYASMIRKWPEPVKQAILLFYDGCRKKLTDDYPEIFKAGPGESEDSDNDMFGILRGLAGGKYGDFEKIEQLPLHTALREMQCLIAEQERMEAELQKAG